jgi:hypothetical protein
VEKQLSDYHWPDARDELEDIVRHTTPLQRLEWLEEMLDFALETGALARAWALEDERRYGKREP